MIEDHSSSLRAFTKTAIAMAAEATTSVNPGVSSESLPPSKSAPS